MYCVPKDAESSRGKSQRPHEAKDEQAIRLRSAGYSFREIADEMGVDVSMAHRRVMRAMIRRRCEQEDRMQDVRDNELEKLRRIEKAMLPDAFEGDRDAARIALRIVEMRRRLLKDLPLEEVEDDPWGELIDDEDTFGEESDNPLVPPEEEAEDCAEQPKTATEQARIDAAADARTEEFLRAQAMKYFEALGTPPAEIPAAVEATLAQVKRAAPLTLSGHPSTMLSTDGSTNESTTSLVSRCSPADAERIINEEMSAHYASLGMTPDEVAAKLDGLWARAMRNAADTIESRSAKAPCAKELAVDCDENPKPQREPQHAT